MNIPTIVIDPGGLDVAIPRGGQFRYVVDLVHGLTKLEPAASFVFLGGSPRPIPELAAIFVGDQCRWRYVPFMRPTGRGAIYRDQLRLTAALLSARAHLYHGLHTIIPVLAPCPVVTTIHDLMYEVFPEYAAATRSRPYRLYRWGVKNRARRAICISRSTANDAMRFWQILPKRLDVVYHGTTFLGPVAVAEAPGVSEDDRVVLSMYNLEPRKNLIGLLNAFARIRRHSGARLLLYGRAGVSPERERDFDALIAELGIGAAVTRTGYLSDEQLAWLYRRADVFAFPSLYEGFGYPVLEAMAAGACVITRAASSMAEIVGNGGLLVETADPGVLGDALHRLLADPMARDCYRKEAVVQARNFTVGRMAEQTWRTYEAALAVGRN